MMRPLWDVGKGTETPPSAGTGESVAARPVAFAVGGRQFLYEPDDMRLYETDDPGRDLLAALARPAVNRPRFPLRDAAPGMVVLVLTRACNLRCRYCFVPGQAEHDPAPVGDAPGRAVMERDTARRAMRMIPPGRDIHLGFFGGEPLLAWERLAEIVADARELARERGRAARFALTTNAILLNDDKAAWLDRHGFGLVLSIDGPPELHDANRPDVHGRGTYAAVLAALERIARHPALAARATLRGTFTGGGGGDGDSAGLLARTIHLNELARRFGFGNVSVEPADLAEGCPRPRPARAADGEDSPLSPPLSRSLSGKSPPSPGRSTEAFAAVPADGGGPRPVAPSGALYAEYLDVAHWYARERREGRRPLFHHFAVRLDRLRRRAAAPSECGAGFGYLAVDPDGYLHACHRLGAARLGNSPGTVDPARRERWRDNRYTARVGCSDCWLRNVCGGGCRHSSLARHGDIGRPDELGCWLTAVCVQCAAWILAEG